MLLLQRNVHPRSCRIRRYDLIVYEFRRHGAERRADCGVKLLILSPSDANHAEVGCMLATARPPSPLLIPSLATLIS
jgi:hypothetical protein